MPWIGLLWLTLLWLPLTTAARGQDAVAIRFFWAASCPHCEEARPFLEELERRYPDCVLQSYEVWDNRDNFELMIRLSKEQGHALATTPTILIGERIWFGYAPEMAPEIEEALRKELGLPPLSLSGGGGALTVPFLGELNPQSLSLPLVTILIGLLDSFNPCAFFVLFFLLGLMVHARSRRSMLLVGGTFVLFSGGIYFLFMAAWLNLFLLAGQIRIITTVAALVALVVAAINIKDFFWFKKGVSLSISDEARPHLFRRMRTLVNSTRLPAVLFGTSVLAISANTYELLCTAGFPMVYTRILTLRSLSTLQYYAYIALYNLVYILPLLAIVLLFTWTLGSHKISEWQGRVLKLVSGMMMLALGLVLLVDPALLNRLPVAAGILGGALAASLLLAGTMWLRGKSQR
jgi:thiol-disulfide isomerase/thioredoxin